MSKRTRDLIRRASRPGFAPGVAVLLCGLLTTGCDFLDELVDVTAPDRIVGDVLETPANLPILMAGAVGDFECGLASYIVGTGMTGDELEVTDGLTAVELYDARASEPRGLGSAYAMSTCDYRYEGIIGVYRPISAARWQADNILTLVDEWTTEGTAPADAKFYTAKAAAYAGYSYLLLGESMCEASIDLSAKLKPADLWALAEQRFTRAIADADAAGASALEFKHLALLGRARTRLNLGKKAEAAADARLIPDGFVKYAKFSTATARRYNYVFTQVNERIDISVDPRFRNRTFQGVVDPRVKSAFTGQVVPSVNMQDWDQQKYTSRSASVPIARWAEAQLIIAEAEHGAGNLPAAVNIMNTLHTRAGLPAFASSNASEILNQIIWERSSEFFLEGHRLGDMQRYKVPLVPTPGSIYHTGWIYGSSLCYPYPGIEIDGNPNGR